MNKDEILAVAQRLDATCVASCGRWTKTPDWRYHGLSCRYRITQEAVEALRELAAEKAAHEKLQTPHEPEVDEPSVIGGMTSQPIPPFPSGVNLIEWHVRQIQQVCDALNFDPTQWLNDETSDGATSPPSAPRPMAWLGFPDGPTPTHDLIYDNATQLPGYRYSPIWSSEDHPSAVRERATSAKGEGR